MYLNCIKNDIIHLIFVLFRGVKYAKSQWIKKKCFIYWLIIVLSILATSVSYKSVDDKFEKDNLEFSREFNWQFWKKEIQVHSLDRYKISIYSDVINNEYNYSFYFIKYDNLTDNYDMYVCYLIRMVIFEMAYAANDYEAMNEVYPEHYQACKQALAEGEHKSFSEEEWTELLKLYTITYILTF